MYNINLNDVKKWLEDNEEELLESYRFDLNEVVKVDSDNDRLKDVCSFEEYARGRYEGECEDEEYEKKNKTTQEAITS